jgi:hypothetical protein
MPPKLPEGYLFDMLETARKMERFIADYDQQHFREDEKNSALARENGLIQHSENGSGDRLSSSERYAEFYLFTTTTE